MIKLIDDIALLDRLSEKEPYFGCLFSAAAAAFLDDPEFLSIWVELDEKWRAHSFLNAGSDYLMLFSPFGLPGAEMVFFVSNLIAQGGIEHIECDENSLAVLKNLCDFDIENAVQMFAKNRIVMPKNGFDTRDSGNFDEAYDVIKEAFGEEDSPGKEFWKLKMVRGVLRKQSTLLTLYDTEAVSTACIRGRTKKAGAITSVVTVPKHRRKGYASYLTAMCANMLIDEHRTPWLVPANADVRKMYEKLGFEAAKEYYYLYNIKEKEEQK